MSEPTSPPPVEENTQQPQQTSAQAQDLNALKAQEEAKIQQEQQSQGYVASNFQWTEGPNGWQVTYTKTPTETTIANMKAQEEEKIRQDQLSQGYHVTNFQWTQTNGEWHVTYSTTLTDEKLNTLKTEEETRILNELSKQGYIGSNFQWTQTDGEWKVTYDTTITDEKLSAIKAEEETRILSELSKQGYYAENFEWTQTDGQWNISYQQYADRSGVDTLLAAGDTGAAFERFMEMKYDDRQEFIQSAINGGNYIDDSTLQFWDISSREAAGYNTKTPATWDSPETVAWYQEGVARSAKISAQNQALMDSLTPQQKALSLILGADPLTTEGMTKIATAEMKMTSAAVYQKYDTTFSTEQITKQNKNIANAIADNDSRIDPNLLPILLGTQEGNMKVAIEQKILNSPLPQGFTAGNFQWTQNNEGAWNVDYDLIAKPQSLANAFSQSMIKSGWNVVLFHNPAYAAVNQLSYQPLTQKELDVFMTTGAITSIVVTAPIATGFGAIAAATAKAGGATLSIATQISAVTTASVGFAVKASVIGVGFAQGFKTGAAVITAGASLETVKGSVLTGREAAEAAAMSVLMAGAGSVASNMLGLTGKGLTQSAGRIGLGAVMGGVSAAASEGILTGEVTWKNVLLGVAIGAATSAAMEGITYANEHYIKPRVETRIDTNVKNAMLQTEVGTDYTTFRENYHMPLTDRILGKITGVGMPSDVRILADYTGRTPSQGTSLAAVGDTPKGTYGSLYDSGQILFLRGTQVSGYTFSPGQFKLQSRVDLATGINLMTGQSIFTDTPKSSQNAGSSKFPIKLGEALVPLQSGEMISYKGLYVQWGTNVKPLLGTYTTILQTKETIPGVSAYTPVKAGYVPETALETVIMQDVMKKTGLYDQSSLDVVKSGIKLMDKVEGVDSKFFTGKTPTSIGTINDQGLQAVKEYVIRNRELFDRFSGTFSATEQYRKDVVYTRTDPATGETLQSTKKPNDLDPLMVSESAAEKATKDVFDILQATGNPVRINPNRKTLIDIQVDADAEGRIIWAHAWDAHVADAVTIEGLDGHVQKIPSIAFGRRLDTRPPLIADKGLIPSMPDAGIPIRRLDSQTLAKLFGSLIPQVTPEGQGTIGVAHPGRVKDPVGAAIGVDTLLTSKDQNPVTNKDLQVLMKHYNLTRQDIASVMVPTSLTDEFIIVPTRAQAQQQNMIQTMQKVVATKSLPKNLAQINQKPPTIFEQDLATIGIGKITIQENYGDLAPIERDRPYGVGFYYGGKYSFVGKQPSHSLVYVIYGPEHPRRGKDYYPNYTPTPPADVPDYTPVSPAPPPYNNDAYVPSPSPDVDYVMPPYVSTSPPYTPTIPPYTQMPPYVPTPPYIPTPPYVPTPPYTPTTTPPYIPTPPNRPPPTVSNLIHDFNQKRKQKEKKRPTKRKAQLADWSFDVTDPGDAFKKLLKGGLF